MGFVVTSVGWSLAPFPRWWSLLGLWVSRAPVDAHSWHDLLLSLRELTGRRLCSALRQRGGLHGGQTQHAGRCSSCAEMAQPGETTAKTWLPRLPRVLAPVHFGVLLFRFKYCTLKDTFAFSHSFQMKFFYISQLAYWLHALPELYFQKTKKVRRLWFNFRDCLVVSQTEYPVLGLSLVSAVPHPFIRKPRFLNISFKNQQFCFTFTFNMLVAHF